MQKMMAFVKNYWKILLGALALIALTLYLLGNAPKLTTTNPTNGAVDVGLNSDIVLTFDRNVAEQNIKIISNPQEDFAISKTENNIVVLSHQKSFNQSASYAVDVYYRSQKITTLNFKTAVAQSNARDLQILEDKMKVEYPLADRLPFTKPTYQVVYIAPLTLQIELYRSDLNQTTIQTEVTRWMTSEGVDPSTHKFVFKEPSRPAPATMR